MLSQASQMMQGGNADPNSMRDMMSNPGMQSLMKNPDFMKNTLNMLKDPNNKHMLDMI